MYVTESDVRRIINRTIMLSAFAVVFLGLAGIIVTLSIYGVTENCTGFFVAGGILVIPLSIAGYVFVRECKRQIMIDRREDTDREDSKTPLICPSQDSMG